MYTVTPLAIALSAGWPNRIELWETPITVVLP
jgi:hypothetical protein